MAKTDPLDAYKLPIGLTEGVEIPLPNTDIAFTVKLPGTMNEEYNQLVMSEMNMRPTADGEMEVDAVKFQMARKRLFFDTCILSETGLPCTRDEFWRQYPLAAKFLWERAVELAVEADTAANDALGKLMPSSNGSHSGGGATDNTTKLSKVG